MKKNKLNILAKNKKANFDYDIKETFEAGIQLLGGEVKGIKAKKISIKESFISLTKGQVILKGSHVTIPEYANQSYISQTRDRILLLNKREIEKIRKEVGQNGMTIVPLKVYISDRGLIKLEIALAKGRKLYDKREVLKSRDIERRGA